jgi:chorismate mutase
VLVVGLAGCAAGGGSSPATAPAQMSSESAQTTPAAPSESPVPTRAFDEVLALVVERLATGDSVAASKLFSGQPVTDEAREKAVLDAAAARATEVGADQNYTAKVFEDQITASKEVQQSLLDAWAAGDAVPPTTAPDLATEVRPILDRITQSLVPALGAVEQFRDDPGCDAAVTASTVVASAHTTASHAALAALPTATADLCG